MTLQLCLNPDVIPPSYTIIHINEKNITDFCKSSVINMRGTKIAIEVALATKGIVELIEIHKTLGYSNQIFLIYHSNLFSTKFYHSYIDQYNIKLIRNPILM